MEKKGRERREESDRPGTSRDVLRPRKSQLFDRFRRCVEVFQQLR